MNIVKNKKSNCGSYFDLLHLKVESPAINLNNHSNLLDFSSNHIQSKVAYFDDPNSNISQTKIKPLFGLRNSVTSVVSKVLFNDQYSFPNLINNRLEFESPKKSIFVNPSRKKVGHLSLINVDKSISNHNFLPPNIKIKQNDLFNDIKLKIISLDSVIKVKNEYKNSLEFEDEIFINTNGVYNIARFDIKLSDTHYLCEVVDDLIYGTEAWVYGEYVELVDSLTNSIKYCKFRLKELISIGFLHVTYVKQMLFMVGRRYNSYNSGDEENSNNTDLKMYTLLNVKFSKKIITYLSQNEKNNFRTNKRLITRIYQ